MSARPAIPFGIWCVFLAVLAGVLAVWSQDPLPPILLGGASAATGLTALAVALRVRMGSGPNARANREHELIPDLSFFTFVVAVGLVAMAIGTVFGFWLVLVGIGTLAGGLLGLVRELYLGHKALEHTAANNRSRRGG